MEQKMRKSILIGILAGCMAAAAPVMAESDAEGSGRSLDPIEVETDEMELEQAEDPGLSVDSISVGTEDDETEAAAPETDAAETGAGGGVLASISSVEDVDAVYQFTLDGVTYALPASVEEFTANGWNFNRGEQAQELIPGMSVQSYWFDKYEGDTGYIISLSLLNAGGDAAPAGECLVAGIDVEESDLGDDPAIFTTAHGISLGDRLADAAAVYGESEREGMYEFWKAMEAGTEGLLSSSRPFFAEEGTDKMILRAGGDDGTRITDISMKYYKVEDSGNMEISSRPEYLDTYTAPAEGQEGMFDFTLNGKAYQLPAPMSEFMDAGWTVNVEAVPGLRNDNMAMSAEEDGSDFSVSAALKNDSEKLVSVADSYVSRICVRPSDAQKGAELSLTGGVTIGSSAAEFFAVFPGFSGLEPGEETEADGYIYTVSPFTTEEDGFYYVNAPDGSRSLGVSVENGQVVSIELNGDFSAEAE